MNVGQRMRTFFFGEPAQQTFAATPILDAIQADYYNNELLPEVTRDEALSVPGVMRARNTICSISTLPLKAYDAKWKLTENSLLEQIDPTRADVATKADTVEDLILWKFAYWRVLDRDDEGYPISAEYVARFRVSDPTVPQFKGLNSDRANNIIRIDGKSASWADVIRFESPNPGFLYHGGRVVKRALDLDVTSAKFARNPRPLDYFTPDGDVDPLDDAGIRLFLQKWKNWLRSEVTGYLPAGIKYVSVDQPTPAELQLIEAQKQVGLSIANMTGLDPEDLGISTTSRTYQNATDRRQDRINDVYSAYMRAITDRLNMGDVTRPGHVVFFDLSDYMKADEKTRADVQNIRLANGSSTLDEVRNDEHLPKLPPAAQEKGDLDEENADGNN